MPLEEEVLGMLIGGFCIVMSVAIILTVLLWIRNKDNHGSFFWTILHFILFSIATYFCLKALSFDYNHPMASEENSLRLGIAGVIWSISIACLLLAIYNFTKKKNT